MDLSGLVFPNLGLVFPNLGSCIFLAAQQSKIKQVVHFWNICKTKPNKFYSFGRSAREIKQLACVRNHFESISLLPKQRLMAKRARTELSAQQWCDVLAPFASKCMLMYDQTLRVQDAKTDPELIGKAGPLLDALHEADHGLNFVRSNLEAGLKQLVSENADRWSFDQKLSKSWIQIHACRLMNICRSVSQALTSQKPPAWTESLPWIQRDGTSITRRASGIYVLRKPCNKYVHLGRSAPQTFVTDHYDL